MYLYCGLILILTTPPIQQANNTCSSEEELFNDKLKSVENPSWLHPATQNIHENQRTSSKSNACLWLPYSFGFVPNAWASKRTQFNFIELTHLPFFRDSAVRFAYLTCPSYLH